MDFTTMSVTTCCEFLQGRNVPGTALTFPEEAVTKLRENCIDGATLLILIDDVAELREIIPNTAHRVQLKRIVANAMKNSTTEKMEEKKMLVVEDFHLQAQDDEVVSGGEISRKQSFTPVHNNPPTVSHTTTKPPPASPYVVQEPSCKRSLTSECNNIPSDSSDIIQTPKVVPKKMKDNVLSPGLPHELPTPDRFSMRVQEAISRDDLLTVRLQLIKDAGNFYYGLCKHPKQGDYCRMAKKLCEQFPELKDVNGDNYWTSVQKQLSMFFRNQRRLSKKPKGKENTPNQETSTTAKKIKLDDDVVANKRNLDLLKTAKKSDFSKATFEKLIDETYNKRRQYIQHDADSVNNILEQCPYLRDPFHVKQELVKIIGAEKVVDAPKRILAALQGVLRVSEELSSEQIFDAVTEIQRRTKKKKVAGKFISFHDPSTSPERMFSSKVQEFHVVCTGTADDVAQVFICGEGDVVYECPSTCLVDALFHAIACYYVFDVGYPDAFQGVLYFLQDVGLLCTESNGFRYSRYNSLLAEVKKFNDKTVA